MDYLPAEFYICIENGGQEDLWVLFSTEDVLNLCESTNYTTDPEIWLVRGAERLRVEVKQMPVLVEHKVDSLTWVPGSGVLKSQFLRWVGDKGWSHKECSEDLLQVFDGRDDWEDESLNILPGTTVYWRNNRFTVLAGEGT